MDRWSYLTGRGWAVGAFVLATLVTVLGGGCGGDSKGLTPEAEGGRGDAGTRQPGRPTPGKSEDGPEATAPSVTSITPDGAQVGSPAPTLVVKGSNFVSRSFVEVEFVPLPTAFISATELRATLTDAILDQVGAKRITVTTNPPGGGVSSPITFEVRNPKPQAKDLEPTNVILGAGTTSLRVEGTGFVNGAKIRFGNDEFPATVTGTTVATTSIPTAKLTTSGSVPVSVVNPAPGGGASSPLSFTIANPNVVINNVYPVTAQVGSVTFDLDVTGSGFVPQSAIAFNGVPLSTQYLSATSLRARVTSSSVAESGNYSVTVVNPAPGGGVSVPVTFQVTNPGPSVSSITPSNADAGGNPLLVVVLGSGFVPDSEVRFDGARQATTFINSGRLEATFSAAQLARAKYVAVTVSSPAPGGGTSSSRTFTVSNPTAQVNSLNPTSVVAGSYDTTVTINGRGFVAGSVAQTDESIELDTTYVSSTQLRAVVPAWQIYVQGSLGIRVYNPSPGSSLSSSATLTITQPQSTTCDTSGVDTTLNASGTESALSLDYTNGPARRFGYAPSDPTYHTCPLGQLSSVSTADYAYAAHVVQNTTSQTLKLEAWAVCGSGDDVQMALYENTSTIPTTDAQRKACSGFMANGSTGAGGFTSPEANGSSSCPGLMASNGGSIVLSPCEKAVVLMMPYNYPTKTRPATVKVRLTP